MTKLIQILKSNKHFEHTQFIFAAATLSPVKDKSKNPRALILKHFPGIAEVNSTSLHSTHSNLQEDFKRIDNESERIPALINILDGISKGTYGIINTDNIRQTDKVEALSEGGQQNIAQFTSPDNHKRILIFCNSVVGADYCYGQLIKYLDPNQFKCTLIHGNLDKDERTEAIIRYATMKSIHNKLETTCHSCDIMICTDIVSRGVDFQKIAAVIHYNFPKDVSNYIHRVGRTCRSLESPFGLCDYFTYI
jgi:superfamily II DNA/RNA helicase